MTEYELCKREFELLDQALELLLSKRSDPTELLEICALKKLLRDAHTGHLLVEEDDQA